ncbi:translation elongation factor Ts [Patulibacter brassicae]|jgi:elongation factor Ts|uniref:Elongation factor Ts n=1 Tax=Patulibacter brassicae TaxID=1705717 RepID=A0ABU4VH69_9ACTN|nr:translation elongation factor Ts [Patulibacter brassicae]MDX8150258.1 translation elongation factor Ts [Patulibacter brassicae]
MSATITAADVKALRQKTGAGMMDCKKALQETDGDLDKAVELLRVKLGNKVGKLADREAAEGTVQAVVSEDGKRGALVEVDCNTDFVARNDDFIAFAKRIAGFLAADGAAGPVDTAALLEQELDGQQVEALRAELSATTGENVVIRRAERFAVDGEGTIQTYIHATGKVGVAVQVDGAADADARAAFGKEVAMHVAAIPATQYVAPEDVPQEQRDAELRVYEQQAEAEGKPAEIREKIAQGKLSKWLKEIALLPQEHINPDKHGGKTIDQLRKDVGDVTVARFVRFQVGE